MRLYPLFGFLLLFGCFTTESEYNIPETNQIELPDSITFMSNRAQTEASLGRSLFYDPILSRDSSVSCASCHFPAAAFGDQLPTSLGIQHQQSSVRNTPPLFNLFWRSSFFYDGGVPRLEQVALAPMHNNKELDFPLQELSLRLQANRHYVDRFQDVYKQIPDPYTITRALAWFQRSLVSVNSPFDQWLAGDQTAIAADAVAGWELFNSERLNCQSCHPAPAFTDDAFHHIGLASEGIDTGRARISHDWGDFGKFKTPSLRNLAYSAPYMHDGSILSLEEIITYFNKGGSGHPLQHPAIVPLGLTIKEQKQLLAFLNALNDPGFINWPAYQRQAADYQD